MGCCGWLVGAADGVEPFRCALGEHIGVDFNQKINKYINTAHTARSSKEMLAAGGKLKNKMPTTLHQQRCFIKKIKCGCEDEQQKMDCLEIRRGKPLFVRWWIILPPKMLFQKKILMGSVCSDLLVKTNISEKRLGFLVSGKTNRTFSAKRREKNKTNKKQTTTTSVWKITREQGTELHVHVNKNRRQERGERWDKKRWVQRRVEAERKSEMDHKMEIKIQVKSVVLQNARVVQEHLAVRGLSNVTV